MLQTTATMATASHPQSYTGSTISYIKRRFNLRVLYNLFINICFIGTFMYLLISLNSQAPERGLTVYMDQSNSIGYSINDNLNQSGFDGTGYQKSDSVADVERDETVIIRAPDICPPHTHSRRDLPRIALFSYPGSGNTWVRHLLQIATGKCMHTHCRAGSSLAPSQ